MNSAWLLLVALLADSPEAYHDAYRLKATSRTLEGRMILAQTRRDEIADRRAKARAHIASSFRPLSDEQAAAARMRLADMLLRQDKMDGWERFVRSTAKDFPDTIAGRDAQSMVAGWKVK